MPETPRPRLSRAVLAAALVVGLLAEVMVLGLAAPLQSGDERGLLGDWLPATTAPWRALGVHVSTHRGLVASVVVVTGCWLLVAVLLARRSSPTRLVPVAAATWAAPLALGAPFLSRDVYAYLAQGELARRGIDPYRTSVAGLGPHSEVLNAVDPVWRHTIPPYGPLAVRLNELAAWVGQDRAVLGILTLRLVAALSVLVVVLLVRRQAPPARRDLVTWLAASPLVLMQLVGAAHLDALVCALVVGSVVLAGQQRWVAATITAVAAAEVKVTAGVLLVALLIAAVHHGGRVAGGRVAVAGLGAGAAGLLLLPSDPLGWARHLSTPGLTWDPFTPSSTLYLAAGEVGSWLGLDRPGWLHAACSTVTVLLAVVIVAWALLRARRSGLAPTAALLLLAGCVGGPVLWPWYLAAPAVLLLLAGPGWLPPAAGLATIGSLMALPVGIVGAQRLSFAGEVIALLCVAVVWRRSRGHVGQGPAPEAQEPALACGKVPS